MTESKLIRYLGWVALLIATWSTGAGFRVLGGVDVLRRHNDLAQTGANTNETVLTPANVSASTFGKRFNHAVDGQVYAQPLVLTGVSIPGKGVHNVLFIATQHDSVYAFDADNADGPNADPLWQVSFINPAAGTNVFVPSDIPGVDNAISPEVGITGTPVIDPDTGTLYVVSYTKEPGPVFVNRLHALDVATGNARPGSGLEIKASVIGFGPESVNGVVNFNSKLQINRCGLVLVKNAAYPAGIVYIAFTSHDGFGTCRGWLMGYNAQSLTQAWAYCDTPNNFGAAIWMGGAAPAVDPAGFIYAATANGPFDPSADAYGDSVLKLSDSNLSDMGNSVSLVDYFTPHNAESLYVNDLDLGSGGVMVLPDEVGSAEQPHLMVAAGKFGTIFLLDRDNLGKFDEKDSQIPQAVTGQLGTTGNCVWGAPGYFNGRIYYHPNRLDVQAFAIANGRLSTTAVDHGTLGTVSYPGPTPSISANGTRDAILWELEVTGSGTLPPLLRAYNATNLSTVLYDSRQSGSRDLPAGSSVKFAVPTVANGKVYVGNGGSVDVYGLLGARVPTPVLSPGSGAIPPGTQVTITDELSAAEIRYTLDGSDPKASSLLYTGPITVTNAVTVIAKAFVPGLTESALGRADYRLFVLGEGTGLTASYYANASTPVVAGTPTITRVDPAIDFFWPTTGPDPLVGRENFCASWRGYVQAQYSETYTFYAGGDDGIRLWVNGQPLVDQWVYQGFTVYSKQIALEAGQFYPIEFDYFQGALGAEVKLAWSSPSTPLQTVPTSQLYPANQTPEVSIISPSSNVAVNNPAIITLKSSVTDPDGESASVTYYEDGSAIGTLSQPPYSLSLTNLPAGSHIFYAEAVDDGGAVSRSPLRIVNVSGGDTNAVGPVTAPASFVPAAIGTGLTGDYYADDPYLTLARPPTLSRLDPLINFNWSTNSPDPAINSNLYCVSWRGFIKPKYDETYTIYAFVDDGARLWVGGQLLVNAWQPQKATLFSNSVPMIAGQLYPIQMDYFQFFQGANAALAWSSPSTPLEYIPTERLFPPNRPPVVSLTSPVGSVTNIGPANVTVEASASDPDGAVAKVVFYENGAVVGSRSAAPYSLVLNNLATGNHFIYAEAIDTAGASARSPAVVVTVLRPDTGPYGLVNRPIVAPFLNLPADMNASWPAQLSGVGAFADTASLTASDKLIPYTVNVPFWSDGAIKRRWFALPYDGALPVAAKWQIAFSATNDWQFPVGTVFVKHMDLATNQMDTNSLRRLETRVLANFGAGQVRAATYRWRSDYSDADLVTAAQTEDITVKTPTGTVIQQWFYPAPVDCLACHTIPSGGVLGTSKTRQMNCTLTYPSTGIADNQIRALNNIGAFNPEVDESVITNLLHLAMAGDESASVEFRARTFLDVNCSYCHFPGGTGQGAFDARITTPLDMANLINGSVQGGIPGSHTIVPGDLDRSRILQRVNTTDPLAKMPPLARNLVDTEGAAILARWIDLLAGASPKLDVVLQSGQATLTWTLGTNQWYLQQSSGIGGGVNWAAGPTPTVTGNQASVTLPATGEAQYFRLSSAAPIP